MRLPQLQARPQRGERPSLDTVRPTDLGLGAVARDFAEVAGEMEQTQALEQEVQRRDDEDAVRPMLQALEGRFETRFAETGASWDGVSPGFARGVTGLLEGEIAPLVETPDLTPGQRDALQRGLTQYREATGQRAIQYEAQRRGALVAEQASAREAVAVGGIMGRYTQAFAEKKAARDQAYDGSSGDYANGVLADHDLTAMEIIASAPEHLKPRVTTELSTQRLRLMGQAMDTEARAEQGYIASQTKTAGSMLVNGVLTAPSLYETAVPQIDQMVAALPRAVQGEARAGLLNDLTEAYVQGLVRDGQQDVALARLNDGSLDARLAPETKARLLNAATQKSEALTTEDWMARLRLQQDMDDNVASITLTGQGTGVAVGQVAEVLGAREAAAYQLEIERAEQTRAATTGFGQMSEAAIRSRLEEMKPVPGAAGFAEQQRAYELASQAAEAEIKARDDDPAAWALRQSPGLAGGIDALGDGDAQTARRQAAGYAVGQLTLQEAVGVSAAERRILPKTTAAALVARIEENPDPSAGLRELGQIVQAFSPPAGADGRTVTAAYARQRMVVRELAAAGADNADVAAAVDLADNPVQLGRYVAARRGGALAAMKPKEKDEVSDAVSSAMAPYLRSFEGVPVSAALTGGRRAVAEALAAEHLRRNGGSVRAAAEAAAEVIAGDYKFVGNHGFRMPRQLADRREGSQFNQNLANRGASRIVASLTVNDGQGFYAPADNGRGLTEAQRRERYADTVTSRGRWMTTPDDAGLVLMTPTLDGGWTPALDREGRAVSRSWSSLIAAGRDRVTGPSARARGNAGIGGGGVPRGVRNNNPGNIEANPRSRWQGQTGSDGRFARFETPLQGLRALSRDLGTKMGRGQTTIRSILSQYAPPSENNTAAYITAVSRRLGIGPDDRIDPNDVRARAGLMAAIVQHENGQQPYSPALIADGARLGMRR